MIGKSGLALIVVGAVIFSHKAEATENWLEFDEFRSCSEIFESTPFDLLLDHFFYRPELDVPRSLINQCIDQSEEDGLAISSYHAGALLVLAERDEEARPLLLMAMDAGILEAHTFYGLSLTVEDPVVAYGVHYRSGDLGWGYGAYFAGMYKLMGLGVIQQPEIALGLLQRANEEGVSAAAVVLGLMYYEGDQVKQDMNLAEEMWTESSATGNSYASYYLATNVMLRGGSRERAIELIRSSASRGNATAQVMLATFLQRDEASEEWTYWMKVWASNPRRMRDLPVSNLRAIRPATQIEKSLIKINLLW